MSDKGSRVEDAGFLETREGGLIPHRPYILQYTIFPQNLLNLSSSTVSVGGYLPRHLFSYLQGPLNPKLCRVLFRISGFGAGGPHHDAPANRGFPPQETRYVVCSIDSIVQ